MLAWLRDNGPVIGALAGAFVAFAAILQLVVVGPMNQRFDAQDKYMNARFDAVDQRFEAVDQRFDAQDERLDLLTREVAELRALVVGIIERVSRNEGQTDFLMQQTAPSPSP